MVYKPTPHDSYFSQMMEIKCIAKSFFISQLPQALVEALDWDTLRIYESARRTSGKRTKYTDITYTCNLKEEGALIYLHCEQERKDPISKMIARVYGYNSALIIQHLKQGNKKAPIIINFLLYNNPRASSELYSVHSFDYTEVLWIEKLHHIKHFCLLNVKQTADEIMARYGACAIMVLLLKRAEERNFMERLKRYSHLIKGIELEDAGIGLCAGNKFILHFNGSKGQVSGVIRYSF